MKPLVAVSSQMSVAVLYISFVCVVCVDLRRLGRYELGTRPSHSWFRAWCQLG